jgi:uncharacterized protein (TIGR03118 family)
MQTWIRLLWKSRRAQMAQKRNLRRPALECLEERNLLSGSYVQTNLVSDLSSLVSPPDPNLKNPWGLVAGPMGPFWISDNGTGLASVYNGSGVQQIPAVTIPPPRNSPAGTTAAPTGVVFNGGGGFNVSNGTTSGSSVFIFATEDGTISGWSPGVDFSHAILAVDNSDGGTGAVYKGLAIGSNTSGTFIYATNFRSGHIDVFGSNFAPATLMGSFSDPTIPKGYAPFGIQNIGGNLFVTYAMQNSTRHDDVAGRAHGFIDVFDTNGNLLMRFHDHFPLDSPWGLAMAPSNFGPFSNELLVGNFGNGAINVFDPANGDFLGPLNNGPNSPIVIDGLWALQFGNGQAAGPTDTLFFTAGINGEMDGLFGSLHFTAGVGNTVGPKSDPDPTTVAVSPAAASSTTPSQAGLAEKAVTSRTEAVTTGAVVLSTNTAHGTVIGHVQAAHDQLFADLFRPIT